MRHVLAPTREGPEDREGEGGWIIAAAETVINRLSFERFNRTAEKRFKNGTAEKTWELSRTKTGPFKASKIL
jgi:hypothetical protein